MKPLLKWVGGKTQLLETILPQIPETLTSYYEPFVGGGSVLLAVLASRSPERVYASDVNPALINVYQSVQSSPEAVSVCLRILEQEQGEDPEAFYYKMRELYNSLPPTGPQHAALFLYLNKTCFRGVYREGPRGFNVPYGHYKSVELPSLETLTAMSNVLAPVVFTCESFETVLPRAKAGDFVYVDPPYAPETATSFVGYVAGGFPHHQTLFEGLKALPCPFLMSNSDVPLVREAFPDPNYKTCQVLARRAIHSKDPSKSTMEVLITRSSAGTS
jgi:DNA adenine methylase